MATATSDTTLNILETKMDNLINKFNQIELDIRATKDKMTDFDNKLKAIEEKADAAKTLADMADSLSRANRGEVELVKSQLQESTDRIANLEQIIDDLQGRLKRNTLIFKGIPGGTEGRPGTWRQAKNFIATLLVDHLSR